MHKKYEKPKHPWDKARIEREGELAKKYGLASKKEIWKAETILRGFRREARKLQAMRREGVEGRERDLLGRLISLKLVEEGATLDDVLGLSLDDVLGRRLQTVVFAKGLASTPKQARQFIRHGHIVIRNRAVTVPSYMVRGEEEGLVGQRKGSTVHEIVAVREPESVQQPGAPPAKEA